MRLANYNFSYYGSELPPGVLAGTVVVGGILGLLGIIAV